MSCDCEFDPYPAGDPDHGEESWHYRRTCASCWTSWYGLHCPHDGIQNPCPGCAVRPVPAHSADHSRVPAQPEQCSDPCDEWPHAHHRPECPPGEDVVRYRGWEGGYSWASEYWAGEGYVAYRGGCDLGAREVRAGTWSAMLDLIDDEED